MRFGWLRSRPGKGTPATVAQKRLAVVGGDLDVNREDGAENFSDLDRFGDSADFVNSLTGGGTLSMQAQASELAYVCWLFFGRTKSSRRSQSASPPKYVFTPGVTTGKWATFWKRVGLSTIFRREVQRLQFQSLRFEGSTANKIVKSHSERDLARSRRSLHN
jgi:hypothetical protein